MTRSYAFEAIGTHWQVDIIDNPPRPEVEAVLLKKIHERIEEYDKAYSRFRADSLVTKMSLEAGFYRLPDDAKPLFDIYERLYRVTGGAVTPLIGQTLVEAGYDATYSLKPTELHALPTWDDVISYTFPDVEIKKPALLDFGAAGKGYLVDIVSNILKAGGVTSFCVDAGGDMHYAHESGTPLDVGLEDPRDTQSVIGVVKLVNKSMCGSAGNRRAWGKFHHIIDPHTLTSPRDILAVWVVADSTLVADALTTALFFVPAAQCTDWKFEYLVMYADASVEVSPGFPGEVFKE